MQALIQEARALLKEGRTATLATLLDGGPYASLVTYAPTADEAGALLLLSRLAIHTKNLLADSRAALLIAKPAAAGEDPLALPRSCFMGAAELVGRGAPEYEAERARFLARHDAAHLFAMQDFELFRLAVSEVRHVGGFGRIVTVPGAAWRGESAGG